MDQDPRQGSGEGPGTALTERELLTIDAIGVTRPAMTDGCSDVIRLAKEPTRGAKKQSYEAGEGQGNPKPLEYGWKRLRH